jgi:hypothetical protein
MLCVLVWSAVSISGIIVSLTTGRMVQPRDSGRFYQTRSVFQVMVKQPSRQHAGYSSKISRKASEPPTRRNAGGSGD